MWVAVNSDIFGHEWGDSPIISTSDAVTRENYWRNHPTGIKKNLAIHGNAYIILILTCFFWHYNTRRWPMISPHKGPVTRKMFPFGDVIMIFPSIEDHGMRFSLQLQPLRPRYTINCVETHWNVWAEVHILIDSIQIKSTPTLPAATVARPIWRHR